MSMLSNRTAVIQVWVLVFGLLVLFGSPATFPPGLAALLAGGVSLAIMRVLWQNPGPTLASVTALDPLLATHPSTEFVSNSWPNSGFRNINIRNRTRRADSGEAVEDSGRRIASAFHCNAPRRHRITGLSVNTIRLPAIAIGLAVVSEMKGGKNITAVGCQERREDGDNMLTSIRGVRALGPSRYALVTGDLANHVGERVRIRGKTVSAGNGTVSVKSETNNEVESGKDLETKLRTEGATGTFEMPFLGVKSLKTLSSSCS
jgi:hypothetical protein